MTTMTTESWAPMIKGIARNRVNAGTGGAPFLSAQKTLEVLLAVENALTDLGGGNVDCAIGHLKGILQSPGVGEQDRSHTDG